MAYQENGTYQIVSNRGNGPALSVYGNSQVSNNRNVIVWGRDLSVDQKWQVGFHRVNGAVTGNLLKSAINTAFGLNIWRGSSNTNNCDIYPLEGNVNDSLLDFLTIDASQNLYRIKLINYNLYLTASGTSDGADVRWQQLNSSSNMQVWKFDTPSTGGGGSGNEISMPVNINQKYTQNSQGIKNTGCAVCCGVDIASFKHNRNYSIADFQGHYREGIDTNTGRAYASYSWTGPNGFSLRNESLASINEAQTIDRIKYYVNQGIPVACFAVGANGAEHWFVAYSAPTGGNTWSSCGIMVLDTYNNDASNYNGRRIPIWQAMTDSYVTWGIDSIRIPN